MNTIDSTIDFVVNDKFQEPFWDERPYLVLFGGAGSGKSFFAAQKTLLRTLNEEDNRTLVVMKIGSKLRQYAFQTMIDVMNTYHMNDLFDYSVAPLQIVCKENGNAIWFSGLDDPESIKSISGIKNIWIEEATSITRNDFQQLNLRLRGDYAYYKQIMLSFNPIDKANWLYQDFFQEHKYYPIGIYRTTFKDNKFVGDDYKNRILQAYSKDPNQMKVYFEGEWGERSNSMIYTNWRVDTSIPTDFEAYKIKYCGIDFGFNDPNVLLGLGFNEDKVFVFKELYFKNYTNQMFINEIKKVVPRHILCIADPHAPGNILEMKNAGLWVKAADKSPNTIIAGINFLKGKEIILHPDCKHTIEEIQSYSYLYDNDMNTYFDKPVGGSDHCMDAMRYGSDPIRQRRMATAGTVRPF